jgi:hypothetical protein
MAPLYSENYWGMEAETSKSRSVSTGRRLAVCRLECVESCDLTRKKRGSGEYCIVEKSMRSESL